MEIDCIYNLIGDSEGGINQWSAVRRGGDKWTKKPPEQ
jgi:hypothetical protein